MDPLRQRRSCHLCRLAALAAVVSCGSCGDGQQPPTQGSLPRACVRATGCGVQPYARVFDCLRNYLDRVVPSGLAPVVAEIYRCAATAPSCADLGHCFGAGSSCDASFQARCDGADAVFCDLLDHRTYRYRCGEAKLQCRVDPQHAFAASCTGSSSSPQPLATAAECPRDGCARTGKPCVGDDLDRCAGAALESCLGGEWLSFDCAALGLGPCQVAGPGTARCGAVP